MTLEVKVDIMGWHTLVEISSARITEWEQLCRLLWNLFYWCWEVSELRVSNGSNVVSEVVW